MISVSKKNWSEKNINQRLIDKISQDNNFSSFLSKLIVSRNFNNEEIYSINNNIEIINNFKKNNDFINASLLFENSIKESEKICIFGDYDVDGSCASALLIRFLKNISHPFLFYMLLYVGLFLHVLAQQHLFFLMSLTKKFFHGQHGP